MNCVLRNVKDGDFFRISCLNLDEQKHDYLKMLSISEGDIIEVIKRIEELNNLSILVKNQNGLLVTLNSLVVDNCIGEVVDSKELGGFTKKKTR